MMTWKDVQDESTEDLVQFIRYKGQPDYKELAEAAFVAFTFRFRKEVIDKCRKVARNWNFSQEEADVIAEKVFERFWRYPLGFEKEKCSEQDFDDCIRLYFFKIIRNCFVDHNNEILGIGLSPYDGSENVIIEFPEVDRMEIPKGKAADVHAMWAAIDKALSPLTPKHKTIYLTYKTFEKEGYKLPRALLKKLREELDLSQNSIRVYKNEAFKTVNQYLKSYGSK